MIDPATLQQVRQFLAQTRTASLATVDDGGLPHAANVQVASDDELRLYFVSSPDSAHSSHLAVRSHVAMTLYCHDDTDPTQLHGLQLHGDCEQLTDDQQWQQAWALYTRKFPFVAKEPFVSLVKLQAFYRFTPTWLRWIDNRRGFGFRVHWQMGRGQLV